MHTQVILSYFNAVQRTVNKIYYNRVKKNMSEEVSMEEQTHTFEKNSTNDVGFRDEILEQLQKQQGPAEEEESKVSEEREKRIRDENQNTIESQNTTEDEKRDIDSRSIYIGNVDYGATPLELQQHFSIAGVVNRVTILMNKFTGQPKGFAYLEFADIEAVNKAVATLDGSVFRDRDLKVSAKRTNLPGFSTTNRGGFSRGRGRGFHRGGFRGRGRGRGNRFSPY